MDFDNVVRRNSALEHELVAVRRKVNGRVEVANQLVRRPTQHRYLVEVAELGRAFVGTHKIDVVAVGREGHSGQIDYVGRQHLNVAAGGDIQHPQALFFGIAQHIDHVAAVR